MVATEQILLVWQSALEMEVAVAVAIRVEPPVEPAGQEEAGQGKLV
jgi:hypothetical protein